MQTPIPEVYVLWHPSCAIGEALAKRIYDWLRPGNGLGPEVFYRSLVAPDGPEGGLPLPLPGEIRLSSPSSAPTAPSLRHSNMQVLILLVDDHLVADQAWRYWLGTLARPSGNVQRPAFLPVALDSTAFNLPAPLAELNFLRPAGLPLPRKDEPAYEDRLKIVVRSLLKQLTESLCRLLLVQADEAIAADRQTAPMATAQPKISIFLSHAKADGTIPAKRIRDYIYSQTQLAAFYDENDIPFGSAFSRVLQASVEASNTAALIAVQSARYAARPWCRRELSLFRRPLLETAAHAGAEQWRLNPIVVVDALAPGGQTAGIPEMGNATHIRWADTQDDQEAEIVTMVLRDALLAAFHSALGRSIAGDPNRIVINWLPDPTTLLHIPRVRDGALEVEIAYPGRGLSGLELDILDELFPRVSLRSFDQSLA